MLDLSLLWIRAIPSSSTARCIAVGQKVCCSWRACMTEDQRQPFNPACCAGFSEAPTEEMRIVPSESCSRLFLCLLHPSGWHKPSFHDADQQTSIFFQDSTLTRFLESDLRKRLLCQVPSQIWDIFLSGPWPSWCGILPGNAQTINGDSLISAYPTASSEIA